jgi:gas vesicle protein
MARRYNDTMTDALKLVGGGIVGVGLGLLLAPRAGRQTRRDIVRLAKTVGSRTDKAVRGFADDVADFADAVGEKAIGIAHSGKEMTDAARKELLSAFETGQKKLDEQKRRVARIIG